MSSSKLYGDGEVPDPRTGRPVSDPLRLVKVSLRPEKVYDDDPEAIQTGLKTIESGLRCLGGRSFFFLVSHRPEPRSRVRSKKGLLWSYPEMRKTEVRSDEIERGENRTSLVSLMDLERYSFDHSSRVLTNWLDGVILISELDTDQLFEVVVGWIGSSDKSLLALDIDRVFRDLDAIPPTVIVRYYAADNGRDETLVVAGHKRWISDAAIECLGNLSVPSRGRAESS